MAAVIASGGGEITGTLSVYVHAVVRSMGSHYGALDHTSNGGEEFRRRFLPGPAAARFGRQAVANLLNRPIASLTWGDYPTLGWLGAGEAAQAAAHPAAPGPVASADVGPLRTLERALERAGALGVDLVGAYG